MLGVGQGVEVCGLGAVAARPAHEQQDQHRHVGRLGDEPEQVAREVLIVQRIRPPAAAGRGRDAVDDRVVQAHEDARDRVDHELDERQQELDREKGRRVHAGERHHRHHEGETGDDRHRADRLADDGGGAEHSHDGGEEDAEHRRREQRQEHRVAEQSRRPPTEHPIEPSAPRIAHARAGELDRLAEGDEGGHREQQQRDARRERPAQLRRPRAEKAELDHGIRSEPEREEQRGATPRPRDAAARGATDAEGIADRRDGQDGEGHRVGAPRREEGIDGRRAHSIRRAAVPRRVTR